MSHTGLGFHNLIRPYLSYLVHGVVVTMYSHHVTYVIKYMYIQWLYGGTQHV